MATQTQYRAERMIVGLVSYLGAALVVIGTLWFLYDGSLFFFMPSEHYGSLLPRTGVLPALGMAVTGLLMIAHAYGVRASLDTADNTRELLSVMQATR